MSTHSGSLQALAAFKAKAVIALNHITACVWHGTQDVFGPNWRGLAIMAPDKTLLVRGGRVCRLYGAAGGAPDNKAHPNYKLGLRTKDIEDLRRLASFLSGQSALSI
jgi:hypothetical protein